MDDNDDYDDDDQLSAHNDDVFDYEGNNYVAF